MVPIFWERKKTNGITDSMNGAYLGPEYSNNNIKAYLDENGFKYLKLKDSELTEKIADLISEKKVIGWFKGRIKFGPRALGKKTIIGDARSPKT